MLKHPLTHLHNNLHHFRVKRP